MSEKPDVDNTGATDEVSLVDLLAVIIKKRRLLISITIAGTVLGLLFSLSDVLKPSIRHPQKVYIATVEAFIDDAPMADSIVPLAKSDTCANFVTQKAGAEAGVDYKESVEASLDPKTRFLTITVKSKSENQALAAAHAGVDALSTIVTGAGGGTNKFIAGILQSKAIDFKAEANSVPSLYPATDGLRLAAFARLGHIEAQAYRDSIFSTPAQDNYAFITLDSLVQNRAATESLALDDYAKSIGEDPKAPSKKLSASLAREVALLLEERADLYRSLSVLPERPFSVVSSAVVPSLAGAFRFKAKTFLLAIFGSLFLGLLAAFAANAWDRVKEDPEAMAKLRAAKRGD
jgi:hypothetical protein